ncbi:MAG: DMT family transporter [Promethearchaeia archaeon]
MHFENRKFNLGYLFAFLSALLYAISTPLNKILLEEITPLVLSGWTYFLSGLLLVPAFFKVQKVQAQVEVQDIPKLLIIILTGSILAPLFILYGLFFSTAFQTSLFLNFEVIFTILLAALIFNERLGKRGDIGIILVIICLLLWSIDFQIVKVSLLLNPGVIFLLLGCFFWAIDNNITQTLGEKSAAQITSIKGIFGGLTSLLFSLLLGIPIILSPPNYIYVFFIGLFSFAFSIILFISALKKIGTIKTSILFSTSPFIAALLSAFFLQETIGFAGYFIFFLTFIGVLLITTDHHAHLHSHGKIVHTHSLRLEKDKHLQTIEPISEEHNANNTQNKTVTHKHRKLTHTHEHSHNSQHRHKHKEDSTED